jgi:trimethylamine:corrinoid methyltransferase-like protein
VNVGPRRRKPAPEVNLRSAIAGTGGARARSTRPRWTSSKRSACQFRDPIALEDWRKAGAKVVGERVYLDRGLVRDLIATIPADFTYSPATPPRMCPRRDALDLRADDRRALPARSRRRAPRADARRSGDVPQAQPHAPALHSSAHHIVEPMDHPSATGTCASPIPR